MAGDSYGQTKQRAKTKSKTTVISKSSKTSGSKQKPKTSAEARRQQAAAQKEIQLTQTQLKENENKVSKNLTELGKLDLQIEETTARIKDINIKLRNLNSQISELEKNIRQNESELIKLREEYLKAVKKMRSRKKNRSDLSFIFASRNMNEALRRMRYLREFASWRNRQTDDIKAKIESLSSQKNELALVKEEQNTALMAEQRDKEKLSVQRSQQEKIVGKLKKNSVTLQAHLKKKQEEAKELGTQISLLIAEEQKKAEEEARRKAEEARLKAAEEAKRKAEEEKLLAIQKEQERKAEKSNKNENSAGKNSTNNSKIKTEKKPGEYSDARKRKPRSAQPSDSQTGQGNEAGRDFLSMRGRLPAPSTGSFVITSRFGRQNLPDLPEVEFDNPGIDAETEPGSSAKAVFQGSVSGVYLLPGYNTVVIVNHGNYYTVYGNIASPNVKTGDKVEAGTMLGTLALKEEDSGHSSIHFEVWKNREKLNPQEWLRL